MTDVNGYTTEQINDLQKCAAELFDEGCLYGDIARLPVEDLDTSEVQTLEAIQETALTLGYRFQKD